MKEKVLIRFSNKVKEGVTSYVISLEFIKTSLVFLLELKRRKTHEYKENLKC